MFRTRMIVLAAGLLTMTGGTSVRAAWTYNSTTQHWYQLTPAGLTWDQAEQWAVANGGHLVTINDAAENAWVLTTFGIPNVGLAIGLRQPVCTPEPSCGWAWANGEPLGYMNWRMVGVVEPNNLTADEDGAWMHWPNHAQAGTWYDAPSSSLTAGVVERAVDPAVPAVSTWGLVIMGVLVLTAGTVGILRRGRAAA